MANIEKLKKMLEVIALKENYKLSNIDIKPISSGGANYTTNLYLATISESLKPDLQIFAKVANLTEEARTQNIAFGNVYKVESFFYKELAGTFERLYNKNQVPAEDRLVMAKFYGDDLTPLQETMFLENLVAKGYKDFDRMKTFDWEYAATAVTQLARFHALGMAIRDENPAEFEKLDKQLDASDFQEFMVQFMEQGLKHVVESLNVEHKERVEKYVAVEGRVMSFYDRLIQDKTTLVHGDFRPSNLMHRRRNGKLEVIPLDYQGVRLGNPVGDLIGFVFFGSDEEFRRFHYQRILDHYYTQLTIALQNLRIDAEKVYPRKAFVNDEIEIRPYGLLMTLLVTGVLTIAPEDAPQMGADLTTMMVKPNELAQERIAGVVNDFIRWGVL